VVNEYISNGSTVNLCAIDLAKAFDNVDINVLLDKLMSRKFPRQLICILAAWYSNSFCVVKWLNNFSWVYKLNKGVRQGGVLSPLLFSLYVDDVLCKLQTSGLGCHVGIKCVNSVMYADDLLLIAASLSDLQKLIVLCTEQFRLINLPINIHKTVYIRVGKRWNTECMINVNSYNIKCTDTLKYLGVSIKAGKFCKFDMEAQKLNCFRAMNGLLAKIGTKNPSLVIHMCRIFCLPILLYGVEAMNLGSSATKKLNYPIDRLFCKTFNVSSRDLITCCQFFTSCLPVNYQADIKCFNFYYKLSRSNNALIKLLYICFARQALNALCLKYLYSDFSDVEGFRLKVGPMVTFW
jgi:hypothetical protein